MLESLRMSLGIKLARRRFHKAKDPVLSFVDAVSGSKRALVIMPLDQRELLSAMNVIEMLKKKFAEEAITVVGDERGMETLRLMPRSHFIQIREADLTRIYHPRAEFLTRLKGTTFDLAIDLNLDLVLPSAYICRESNARVRVGFAGPNADSFFNLQIQPDPTLSRTGIYDRVARCLHMF
ncbi:MAG: hypothetical protein HY961_08675 [Ignavibacteriae bacterium]|nr:hypothetical protein [Ignavibacteriota bacterium]